jgi:single-strand DNA-binding protein
MPVSNVRLGESHAYRDAQGNAQKDTNRHNLFFCGDLSDVALTYDRGDSLFVEGSIEQRKFTPAKDGVQRAMHEIIVRSCFWWRRPGSAAARVVEPDLAPVDDAENGAVGT